MSYCDDDNFEESWYHKIRRYDEEYEQAKKEGRWWL